MEWKPFSLEQVNSKEGPDWKLWEQPDDYPSRGLPAFLASEAARRQGPEAFDRLHIALLRARHEDKRDITDRQVILELARQAGLDLERFKEDLADRALLKVIGDSHTEAVEQYGVFGVPTFLFPNGGTAYLKMFEPPEEELPEVADAVLKVMGSWLYIGEIKRPQPPWPKGAFPQ